MTLVAVDARKLRVLGVDAAMVKMKNIVTTEEEKIIQTENKC